MKFKNPFVKIKSNNKLLSLKNEYGYLGYAFLIPAVIMLGIYIIFGHKPFGDFSVLTLDLNAQYVYFYEALREFLHGDASLLYSFSRSLGGEFMGIYAYYIASPFSYIVALFPKSMMLFALLTIIVLKIGLCGLSFGFYLHKQTNKGYFNTNNIIIFSTMYALSAYAITYQNNIMWLDALYLLPLLTYAIEMLVKKGKIIFYIVILATVMITHYYIGYMLCWYTLLCFFFTYFKEGDKSILNPLKEKWHFIKSFLRIGFATVIGIGMAAFVIAAAYYSLQFGKNEFSEPVWDFVARFDLFDLFPKLLPGSYDTVMHEGLPLLYSGVLTLFMVPIFVMAKRVPSREKVYYGAFTLLFVLLMVINPTDLVMHGFQAPNCLNYRYSFIVIFLLLVMAYKGFCEIQEHSPKKIFATGSVIIILLLLAQKMEFPNFVLQDTDQYKYGFVLHKLPFLYVIIFTLVAVFAIGAALCYLIKSTNKQRASQVLAMMVCIELLLNGVVTFGSMRMNIGWGSYSSYADYFEKLTPVVEMVQNQDQTFYRSEKTTHRCTNDNMALNIKGLSNSTSTLNQTTLDLINYLGFYQDAHWSQYFGSTVLTDSFFDIKYIYSEIDYLYGKETHQLNAFMDRYFEKVAEDENYYAYKNPYSLGIAFGASNMIKELETNLKYEYTDQIKNPFEVQNLLLNTLLGNEYTDSIDFFTPIQLNNKTMFNHTNKSNKDFALASTVNGGKEYSLSSSDPAKDAFEFAFAVEKTGPLYLYLPTNYDRGFTLYINGEYYVQSTKYARIIFLGYREAGEELSLTFRLDEGQMYFYKNTNYLYTLDMDEFEHAIEKLQKTSLATTEKSTDSRIFGTMTTYENNQTIMTTIPYDEGWNVYVDGKKVETYSVYGDSLIAFDIANAGEHEIELRYMPSIYVKSAIVSAVSTVAFIGLCAIEISKSKKKKSLLASDEVKEEPTKTTEGEN